MITDTKGPADKVSPLKPAERVPEAKANIEKLTRQLERGGVDGDKASAIAERITTQADGPIALDDWMKMEAARFSTETQQELLAAGLTREVILADSDKAEDYVACVFKSEGIPNGSGGVDKPKQDVVSGQYKGRWGIDLVAAEKREGCPILIEVKKYKQPSSARLAEHSVELDPVVAQWKAEREGRVSAQQLGDGIQIDPDALRYRSLVEERQTAKDRSYIQRDWLERIGTEKKRERLRASGVPEKYLDYERLSGDPDLPEWREFLAEADLPAKQMDDLWARDRWLKIIEEPEGRARMSEIGVDAKYLDYDQLCESPDQLKWQQILDHRTTVIVSGSGGDAGSRLFLQAVRDGRSSYVVKIEV
jgi:DNA primase